MKNLEEKLPLNPAHILPPAVTKKDCAAEQRAPSRVQATMRRISNVLVMPRHPQILQVCCKVGIVGTGKETFAYLF